MGWWEDAAEQLEDVDAEKVHDKLIATMKMSAQDPAKQPNWGRCRTHRPQG
jgi:hypothetical protein